MKRLRIVFILLLSVAWRTPTFTDAANVQFDASTSSDFTVATNWADDNAPTADGDVHFIENGLTADLTGTATVNGVVIGDVSVGTLNVNGGTLNVDVTAGFPQGFSVSGHLGNHTGFGTVNVTNGGVVNVNLMGGSPDTGFVGERSDGVLNIGPGSTVNSPQIVWRIGQFGGPFGDPPHEADGIVNVEGTWNADIIFLAPSGGDAEVNVSGNGSVFSTRALDARAVAQMKPFHSSIIRMIGSNASWDSDDILLDRQGTGINQQPRDHVMFVADAGGVSEMVSRDAILFNDAEVTVDLTSYHPLAPGERLRLFDARPGQLANGHVFGVLNVLGVPNTAGYHLVYEDDATGDIFLTVPEPSSAVLLLLGFLSWASKRRRSQ
jgi:hypothetical protein